MPNFNKVILAGNVTRAPETRYTPKGTPVCKFGLAINRQWKTDTGEKKEDVCFVDCTTFGKQAETFAQYVRKGHPVLVEGRLDLDTWEDKESGDKRQKLTVIVEGFQFLKGKEKTDAPESAE